MCNPQPTIITLLCQHQFLRFSHQNIESYPAGKTPRYRPWITASSLLRSSGDVVDGETAAQMCLCKNGCQVGILTKVIGGQNRKLMKISRRSTNCLIRKMDWLLFGGPCASG